MPGVQFFGLLAGGIVALIAIIGGSVSITRAVDRQTLEIALLRQEVGLFRDRLDKVEKDLGTLTRSA